MKNSKLQQRVRRKIRVRGKISGSSAVPRVSIFRSNKHIEAQIINDAEGKTVVGASDLEIETKKLKKTEIAKLVGEKLAQKAAEKKIEEVVFDRNGYRYHGRVKELAEGLRAGGLKF